MDLKYRYPGIKPFLTEEQNLFFGRDTEIKKVLELIDLEKNLVIFSKSGIGKSSLINAGIIPQFETNYKHYKYVNIRFGTYFENNQQSPVQKIIEELQKKFNIKPLNLFINSRAEGSLNTLWTNIKSLQLENQNNTFVLIFDQFEELFSYPEHEINLFKNQLYELLYTKIPQSFKNALNELISENQDIISHETLNILETLPKVKLIFSIRSDRMSFLNQLKDVIPSILQNAYEIKALSNEQAVKCITEPAKLEGNFVSEKFEYEPKALAKIIDYLSNKKSKPIETFQLQIICQHLENKVIENKLPEINNEHIQNIENIFNDYYLSILNKIPDNDDRTKAQILIEEKLIIEERRISLDEIICKKEVSESVLQILVDSRLIRRMPNSTDGFSYEISHDTLISPILKIKKIRNQHLIEQQQKNESEKRIKELKRKQEIEIEIQKKKNRNLKIILFVSILGLLIFIGIFIRLKQLNNTISFQNIEIENKMNEIEINNRELIKQKSNLSIIMHEVPIETKRNFLSKYAFLAYLQIENRQFADAIETSKNGLEFDSTYIELKKTLGLAYLYNDELENGRKIILNIHNMIYQDTLTLKNYFINTIINLDNENISSNSAWKMVGELNKID